MFVYLISSVAGKYLLIIKENEKETGQPYFEPHKLWLCGLLSAACYAFLFYFSINEIKEFYRDPLAYVKEFFNWLDLVCFSLNITFLTMLLFNVMNGLDLIDIHVIRTVGALAGWIMWIKVFYWMRVFKETSYFIILINRTMTDSASFIIMFAIIIFAFANYNFIL